MNDPELEITRTARAIVEETAHEMIDKLGDELREDLSRLRQRVALIDSVTRIADDESKKYLTAMHAYTRIASLAVQDAVDQAEAIMWGLKG
jgi:hypothetical protein